jgi:hypothetical protein
MGERRPLDPANPYGAGPNAPLLEDGLRQLERVHDDTKVRDALGRIKAVAIDPRSGLPTPCYVYRLSCGHLVSVWTVPLPERTTALYCVEGDCLTVRNGVQLGTDRAIAELLNPDGMT